METILRVKALMAYYKGLALPTVAACYDVSERSVKNWVQRFEQGGEDGLDDKPRSGRPVRLPPAQAAELKSLMQADNQRVWTARHVWVTLTTVFAVSYSVKYLPEWLRKLGLRFHKAVQAARALLGLEGLFFPAQSGQTPVTLGQRAC